MTAIMLVILQRVCRNVFRNKEMPKTRSAFHGRSAWICSSFGQKGIDYAAVVIELPIDKGHRHFIFKFSRKFTRGILIRGWLSFRFSVLATAGYDRYICGAPSLYIIGGNRALVGLAYVQSFIAWEQGIEVNYSKWHRILSTYRYQVPVPVTW